MHEFMHGWSFNGVLLKESNLKAGGLRVGRKWNGQDTTHIAEADARLYFSRAETRTRTCRSLDVAFMNDHSTVRVRICK